MASILIFGLLPIGQYGAPSTLECRLPGNASQSCSVNPGQKSQGDPIYVDFNTNPSGISPSVA